MGNETGFSNGLILHGELSTTDASAGVELPLYTPDGSLYHVGTLDEVSIIGLSITLAVGGQGYFYADFSAGASMTFADSSTGLFYVTGDVSNVIKDGTKFAIYGSQTQQNDGEYTAISSVYTSTNNTTVVEVASIPATLAGANCGLMTWNYLSILRHESLVGFGDMLVVEGDQSRFIQSGRNTQISASSGSNGATRTLSANSFYDSDADETFVNVQSGPTYTGDGNLIILPTDAVGRRYARGSYGTNGGREREYPSLITLSPGHVLHVDAAAGQADFEAEAFLRRYINRLPFGV